MPLLEVRELVAGYGDFPIIGPLSFTLDAGEVLLIYGPNGISKTTLFRTIATLPKPLSGSILIEGEAAGKHKGEIFFIPETIDLPLKLKVGDYMRIISLLYGGRNVEPILDELGLQKSLVIEHLSQGLRRRLQLASTLVAKAKIYVLDDPTVGLDDHAVEHLVPSIVSELANRGAVLLSTKEGRLIEVLSLLDKVKVIHALKYSRMATKI